MTPLDLSRSPLLPDERFDQPPPVTFPAAYGATLTSTTLELPASGALRIAGAKVNHEAIVARPWPLSVSFARAFDGERFERLAPRIRFAVKNYLLRRPVRAGTVLWCIDNLSPDNWYHWLTEVLPRLFVARQLYPSVDFVAFPEYYRRNRYVCETLDLWDELPPLLWIPRTQRVVADPLLLVERAAPPWAYRPSVMRALSDSLIERSGLRAKAPLPARRLYVTRSDAAWRRVANEGEVERLLHEEGFTTVSSGSLSVAEQILLFSQATHVVGAHGAGLANMVFCRPGSRVIELATDDPHEHWRCYHNLASAMGLQYALVCARTTASAEASFEERRDADLLVDPDTLKEAVTAMND